MDAVRDAAAQWPLAQLHFESFVEGGGVLYGDVPFAVRLARSGRTLAVPAGRSILAALRDAGMDAPSSCESGTCGTCRTALLAGEADHRDMVLMPEEQHTHIMVCVSRARSAELVLDL
jgi:phthalate 4,5-dioxygenase reductase subunit